MLTLTSNVGAGRSLPAFTNLCIELRPLTVILPVVAAGYCVYVWMRKTGGSRSWVNFFAATMCTLVLVVLPTFVASYLPLIDTLNHLGTK